MKAKVRLISNIDEIQECNNNRERLGVYIEIPKEIYESSDMLFNLNDVKYSYINPRGNILIAIDNDYFEIEYNNIVWDELKKKFL